MSNELKNIPTFYMTVGLPFSGKTEYIEELSKKEEAVIYKNSCKEKEELIKVLGMKKGLEKFIKLRYVRVINRLNSGMNAIIDGTNVKSKNRAATLREVGKVECKKVCLLFVQTYEECLKKNIEVGSPIPEDCIKDCYYNWETPAYFEGWDEIKIIGGESLDCYIELEKMVNFDQKNHHHVLTLDQHCLKARDYIEKYVSLKECTSIEKGWLKVAALLHDIGKLDTQVFFDPEGNPTEEARYYSHHNVGAYRVLCMNLPVTDEDLLHLSALVGYHMHPYFWKNPEKNSRILRRWGREFFDEIQILHRADVYAH